MQLGNVSIYDNYLSSRDHRAVWDALNTPSWAFGAYSDGAVDAHRYFYKHFAGYRKSGGEQRDASDTEEELRTNVPLIFNFWQALKTGPLRGEALARCYANGMPAGAEGGLHMDSNIPTHLTAIYYPTLSWQPSFAGETLFFNPDGTDITAAVYPKPNRLVVFSGTTPHVARPTSVRCPELRITLMFKTLGQG